MRFVHSTHNDIVKGWKRLAQKPVQEPQGTYRFFAEGEHMTGEAIHAGKAVSLIVQEDKLARYNALISTFADDDVFCVSSEVIQYISDTRTPQGIACICSISISEPVSSNRIVALEGVQDPGNVGTILRTMDAAGFDHLIIDRACANPFSPKASRASMGAIFRIGISFTDDLPQELAAFDHQGYTILAGDLRGSDLYAADYDPSKVCILIGNEGSGLTERAKAASNMQVRIPMPGHAESLNAGVACAIMIYDVLRRSTI